MKKVLILGVALLAFAAFVSLPASAYACGKQKTSEASSASKDNTGAMNVASKGGSCDARATEAKTVSADKAADSKYAVATMSVKGMTCGSCEKSVTAALEHVDGVVAVERVSYRDNVAVVKYDPSKCQEASLAKAVADKGYTAEVIPAVATSKASEGKVCAMTGATCTDAQKAACAAKEAKAETSKAEASKAAGTY